MTVLSLWWNFFTWKDGLNIKTGPDGHKVLQQAFIISLQVTAVLIIVEGTISKALIDSQIYELLYFHV